MTATAETARSLQSRMRRTLVSAQTFSGLGNGSTLALGSILAVDLSGSEAWAGSVNTSLTLGTAVTAIPLAQLALSRGRRFALASGLAAAIATTVAGSTLLVAALAPSQRIPAQGFSDAAMSLAAALAVVLMRLPELGR